MKLTNVIVQGILLIASLIIISIPLVFDRGYMGRIRWEEVLLFSAFAQFFIGTYQFVNAIIITIRKAIKKQLNDYYKLYWLAVLVYAVIGVLLLIVIEEVMRGSMPHDQSEKIYSLWFVSSWIIAVYYFVITIMDYTEYKKELTR